MEERLVAKGAILSDNDGQRWIVGSFIGLKGIAENYEAAIYDDNTPTDYPAILQIVPQGDEPLPDGFQFYLDHAKRNALDTWKKVRHLQHLGIPVLLGTGSLNTNCLKYQFIIVERHGKDLWSLFVEHDKKFEAHTVYKISLQIMSVLKYTHSQSYYHEDIKASNITVDTATQNHIYLVNDQLALYTVSNDQVDLDKTCNGTVVLLSRDAHMGASSKRGDIETLFYNLVQWLGIELPWEKHFENTALVLKEKEYAFADVEKFLQNWSNETAIPTPVCEYMKLLARLDTNDEPVYSNFMSILVNGLKKLYHVPSGKLEFSISNIPFVEQIEEDTNRVNKPQKKGKNAIIKLGISVAKLANIISENCRHLGEVKLRDNGPGSLIEIICGLTCKKKNDYEWQNKLVKAWEKDSRGLKTMTKELWKEKELRAKGISSKAASSENTHEVPSRDSTVTAATSTQKNTNGLNHSNPGASSSQRNCETMSPDGMPQNEHTASLDLSNISSSNGRTAARSPSPSRWSGVQSSPYRPSTSGYSSHSSMQDDSHFENTSFSRTSDTEHGRLPEVVAVGLQRETGRTNEEASERWMSESVDCESWQDDYEMLNTWLKMKEPYLNTFDSFPSEPQMIIDRVQQVRVLLGDFRTHNPQRHRLEKVLAKLPRDSADALKLEQIEYRWWKLLDWLEKHGQELGEASLDQPLHVMQSISKNLDKLLLDKDPEEQKLHEMEILHEQLDVQRALLANATNVAEQLCQALSRQAYTYGLRVKLRSVESLYLDLQQKMRIKRAEVESSLGERRQFEDLCKDTRDWLLEELTNTLLVSTNRATLQQQHEHYTVESQRVMDKQTEVMEILNRGRNQLRSHNILDSIESLWDRLSKQSLNIVIKLKTCAEACDKFYQTQDRFLRWLNEAERKLERFKPASLSDIEKQLKELSVLHNEVREKAAKFEYYDNLGHTFIAMCDEDTDDIVKNELNATKNRWTKLNHDLLNHLQSFGDINKRFAGFNRNLLDLHQKIGLYENESASYDVLEAVAKDSKLLRRMRELEKEMTSLQVSIDVVRQQADVLVLKAREQGIDASHLLGVVNSAAARIDNLKIKFGDTRSEILEQEHARLLKEILADEPVENLDSCKTRSESKQDRVSEPNSPKRNKKKSESPPRKRSQSKDSVSSSSKSSKNNDGSKSQKSNKIDEPRPKSDLSSSEPKGCTHSKVSDNSYRDSRLPRHGEHRPDRSHYCNNRPYYYSDHSLSRGSNQRPYWQRPNFGYRPDFRQDYRPNTFSNFERRDGPQSLSPYDSRFGRDNPWWRSQDPRNNQRWGFHQNQPFRNFNRETSAYGQATRGRDRTRGCESNVVEQRERQKGQDDTNVKCAKSNEGLRKGENTENQLERNLQKVSKPLVSYTYSDEDSDRESVIEIKKEPKRSPKY